jgi:hypothetical protein
MNFISGDIAVFASCPKLAGVSASGTEISGQLEREAKKAAAEAIRRIIASGCSAVAGWDLETKMSLWRNVVILPTGGVEVNLDSSKGEFNSGCSLADFVAVFGARLVKIGISNQTHIEGRREFFSCEELRSVRF